MFGLAAMSMGSLTVKTLITSSDRVLNAKQVVSDASLCAETTPLT